VPEALSDEQAAFWTLGLLVMNAVRLAEIKLGEAAIVVGAGLLGQLAASLAALSGAWPVIVVDLAESRLKIARARGATHVIAASVDDAREQVHAILGGHGAEVVFEVTGSPHVVPGALRLARRCGRVILLGSSRGPSLVDFHDEVHTLGLQIIGAHASTAPQHETPYNSWTPQRNGALFLDLVAAGRLRVDDLVTHRYLYRDALAAYDLLLADRTRAMGVILTYEDARTHRQST
jgi:threonine dehydrogenase-like Zn-dependent dehydrogenase